MELKPTHLVLGEEIFWKCNLGCEVAIAYIRNTRNVIFDAGWMRQEAKNGASKSDEVF